MAAQLKSERMIVQAPTSYVGSTKRLWRMTRIANPWVKWALAVPATLLVVLLAWVLVTVWYAVFGLLLLPYRLLRRGARKRKLAEQRHREMLGME